MEETEWQQNERKKTSYYPRIQSTNNENGEKINKGDNRGEEKLLNKISVVESKEWRCLLFGGHQWLLNRYIDYPSTWKLSPAN